jgi:hypothetical protein
MSEKPFDGIGTDIGPYREGYLGVASAEFDDRIEFYITDGLGNYSVVKIKLKDGAQADPFCAKSAWVEVERYKPDQFEDPEKDYAHPEQSVELFLFDVRSIE